MAFQAIVRPEESRMKAFFKGRLFKVILGLIILGGLVFLWYKYVGILVVNSNQEGCKIEIANKKYENVKKKKIIFLKPGIYVLNVSKADNREFQELILVKSLGITKKEIILSKMFYVSSLSAVNDFDVNFLAKFDENNLIYFSANDNSFYKVPLDFKSSIIGNYNAVKINTDLGLSEGDQVFEVRYSPSKTQALIFSGSLDAMSIKLHDFNSSQTKDLNSPLFSANWMADSNIIGITDIDSPKLVKMDSNGLNIEVIADLPADPSGIYASYASLKYILAINSNLMYLVNPESKEKMEVELPEGLETGAIQSPSEDKFIVLTSKESKTKVTLLNSDGSKEEIAVEPYLNNVIWTSDGQGLIYVSFDESQKAYNLGKYTFSDKKNIILASYAQAEGGPSNLVSSNSYVNFILDQSVMGLKIQ